MKRAAKTFGHDDEEERGERVSLSNSSRGGEGSRGSTIDKNGEKCRGGSIQNPSHPEFIKVKGKEHFPHVVPTYLIEGFRKVQFKEHTWRSGILQRVDHFMS